MRLLDKYFIPMYQAPEPSGALTTEPMAPVDPPVEPVAIEPEPAPVPTPPRRQMVPVEVVADLREKKRGLESENERLQRELTETRALAERLARNAPVDPTNPAPPAPPRQQFPAQPLSDDAEIDRRADQRLFVRDVSAMRDRGLQQFGPSFMENIKALASVEADSDAFVSQVMAVDPTRAHVMLHELAQDLEKTVSLVNMDPTRRIAELTRMAMTATARNTDGTFAPAAPPAAAAAPVAAPASTTAKTVSRAPAPPPPVEPSATRTVDWRSDESSEEEFTRGFQEMMAKRSQRR